MMIQAFKYTLSRDMADGYENDETCYTHIECAQETGTMPETVEVTGTRLEYVRCANCGEFLDDMSID
jgi:hypothetical protein